MTDKEVLKFIHNLFMYCKENDIKVMFKYYHEYHFLLTDYNSMDQLSIVISDDDTKQILLNIGGSDLLILSYMAEELTPRSILDCVRYKKDCTIEIYKKFADIEIKDKHV